MYGPPCYFQGNCDIDTLPEVDPIEDSLGDARALYGVQPPGKIIYPTSSSSFENLIKPLYGVEQPVEPIQKFKDSKSK